MKPLFVIFLLLLSLAVNVSAQTNEARQIDEFGRLPCGDFTVRMQNIFLESQKSPDSKIYVVYYGGRVRKEIIWSKKGKKIQLKYPHRDDGLNSAKSIFFYLTTSNDFPVEIRNSLKDKIILVNGGFQENVKTEIWFVPNDAEPPKPTPTVAEKDIKFRKDKPFKVAEHIDCYGAY